MLPCENKANPHRNIVKDDDEFDDDEDDSDYDNDKPKDVKGRAAGKNLLLWPVAQACCS
tara:strand:+ start:290 stop:466 length:177 start_codon:yes stop_codon:yes gene_type:complete